jgi:hypothetical protein
VQIRAPMNKRRLAIRSTGRVEVEALSRRPSGYEAVGAPSIEIL